MEVDEAADWPGKQANRWRMQMEKCTARCSGLRTKCRHVIRWFRGRGGARVGEGARERRGEGGELKPPGCARRAPVQELLRPSTAWLCFQVSRQSRHPSHTSCHFGCKCSREVRGRVDTKQKVCLDQLTAMPPTHRRLRDLWDGIA